MSRALYPGSFDPVTYGHIDIAERASSLFDELIIGVYATPQKNILFPVEERVRLFKEAVKHLKNVKVTSYSELTIEFAKKIGAKVIVRGMRMTLDFEREFEMALMNRKLYPEIETVCLITSPEYQFLSSSLVKEIAELGGNVDDFVPSHVAKALKEAFRTKIL